MAKLRVKNGRRCRVQLSVTTALWEQYQANLAAANRIRAEIDFGEEFEAWFKKQNDDIARKIIEFTTGTSEQAAQQITAAPQVEHFAVEECAPAAGVAAAAAEEEVPEGGNDHGRA